MIITVNKFQVGSLQLNTAINLYFSKADLVSVHTLAGAAHIIFHDLVEHKHPNESWENVPAQNNNLSLGNFLNIARNTQNFLKHAKNDPEEQYSLNSEETEHLLFLAIQNLCILLDDDELLSNEASVFQIWFMAVYNYPLNKDDKNDLFLGIDGMSKNEQIEYGNNVLTQLNKNT